MKKILILILLSFPLFIEAQNGIQWQQRLGGIGTDQANCIIQTADSGYVIAGSTAGFGAGGGGYLIKTNSMGDTLWTRIYDSVSVTAIQQTYDGGYIITGSANSNNGDVALIKTDMNGNPQWFKAYGGTANNIDEGYFVRQTTDSGYVVVGIINITGLGQEVYLIKTNANGDTLWTKAYCGSGPFDGQWGYSVQQTRDGGYILVGTSNVFTLGVQSIYVIKTNSTGDTLWTKIYGGIHVEEAYSIQQTADGGYVIAGGTNDFPIPDARVYLIKTDSLGNSDCNQGTTQTNILVPNTIVSNLTTGILHGGIVNSTSTTVGSFGTDTTLCFTVGIVEVSNINNSISIYPNPTSGIFTIKDVETRLIASLPMQLCIYDLTSREIYTQAITNQNQSTIDISNLCNGVYFYQLTTGKETYRGRIVKQ